MAKSDRSSESIEKLLQERSQYEQWLARLDGSGAPDSVRTRVRADYESRLDNVMAQLRAHESTIAEALGRHHTDRERLEGREAELLETLAEAEVRHTVGEYDDKQWNDISGSQKKSLGELRGELDKVRSELTRLTEVQRLIRAAPAAPAAAMVEPEPEPVVPAPAEPVAFEPPPPVAPSPAAVQAPAEPSAPRFVPRPPAAEPARKLAGDELDFLKSVAVEQSASLSPAAAEKQRASAGQGSVTTTTPPPEPSPQVASPAPQAAAPRASAPAPAGAVKTLKCGDCGTLNRPTEWYCERCGAELAAL
jgi:hypothetical protein